MTQSMTCIISRCYYRLDTDYGNKSFVPPKPPK